MWPLSPYKMFAHDLILTYFLLANLPVLTYTMGLCLLILKGAPHVIPTNDRPSTAPIVTALTSPEPSGTPLMSSCHWTCFLILYFK